jgi:apolipoprotein N-acyltransferase
MNQKHPSISPVSDRWSFLWLGIGTLLMIFIGGSWPLPLAGWLAPVFMLRFMRTRKLLPGFILVVCGLTIANTIAWRVQNPMPFPALVFGAVIGLSGGLAFLVDRLLVPRFQTKGRVPFTATLVFPLFLTAYEFLLNNKLLFGSVGSWAYSQHSSLILMQLASITGIWGLTFLIGWFASVVNWAWERSFSWSEIRGGLAVIGGILFLVVAYGNIRLTFFFPNSDAVRVHSFTALEESGNKLITEELIPLAKSDLAAFRHRTASINELYLEGSIREAQSGAKIVVWPEAAALGTKEDIEALVVKGQAVAQAQNIYLAMSVFILDPNDGFELRLMLADPNGKIVINHLKYAYGMGDPLNKVKLQTVDTPYGRLSGVECGDGDIPGVIQQAGKKGVDILLIPSMENTIADLPWHARFIPFRAVENGFSVVRQVAGGVSIATDPYGRILASMNHYTTDSRVMVAYVPTRRVQTVYSMVGDLFGWLTVFGFVILTIWAILLGRKQEVKNAAG